jgi:hypothetical protein
MDAVPPVVPAVEDVPPVVEPAAPLEVPGIEPAVPVPVVDPLPVPVGPPVPAMEMLPACSEATSEPAVLFVVPPCLLFPFVVLS